MHSEKNRNPEEIITDKILLLSLFSLSSQKSTIESMLKAEKLSFIAVMPLFTEQRKAFSLEFYRHNKGAMSNGVYAAIDDFHKLGFMTRNAHHLSNPTDHARELVNEFLNEVMQNIPENRFIYDQLISVAKEYGNLSPARLTDIVYDMRVPVIELNREMTVRETPMYRHFTMALDENETKSKLIIPDDWMDTLAIALSPINYANFLAAQNSPIVYERP